MFYQIRYAQEVMLDREVGAATRAQSGSQGGTAEVRVPLLSTACQSLLRAAAPVFISASESEVDIGGVGGAPWMLHRPMSYDGKTTWDAYLTQFELLSRMNH